MVQGSILTKLTRQQVFTAIAAVTMLVLTVIVPALASAVTLNERSITPSSMAVQATGVQYQVEFTPETAAGALVIEFCSNTPLLGQSCVAPVGFSAASATTSDASIVGTPTANKIVATKTMTTSAQTITLSGMRNPDNVGVMYARIATYTASAGAAGYESDDPDAVAPVLDSGSVALYFNDSVSVSGTVLETLTFCVSGGETEIGANCEPTDIEAPIITLGQEVTPGVFALTPGVVSTGVLHTQINTNAANGAVVRLRSSAECGGLMRAGTTECDIVAAMQDDVLGTDNSARFGVKTAAMTPAPDAVNPSGTFQAYVNEESESYYGIAEFAFNYDENGILGVTSPFGDPFLDTAGGPATGRNMALTFGASVSTNTPAGQYSTDLSMIAVGKF